MKPFSESCEQNKHPILDTLKDQFSTCENILEIGSGTGQHAVFFADQIPHLHWQPSDQQENIPGIQQWLADYPRNNLAQPIILNVIGIWPTSTFDGIFSANTTHIMGWTEVIQLFKGVGEALEKQGIFCLYGPFNYNQQYSSESNARFDHWLKQQNTKSGIRDFEELNNLAKDNNLSFKEDIEMPANNRIIVWQKN